MDSFIMKTQRTKNVSYAGALAGYMAGLHKVQNRRILVTDSPTLLPLEPGEWPTIEKLLMNLLGAEQVPHFVSWLKVAVMALRGNTRDPGQVLVTSPGAPGPGSRCSKI